MVASVHGEKTLLLSLLGSTKRVVVERIVTATMSRIEVTGIAIAAGKIRKRSNDVDSGFEGFVRV